MFGRQHPGFSREFQSRLPRRYILGCNTSTQPASMAKLPALKAGLWGVERKSSSGVRRNWQGMGNWGSMFWVFFF
ncbi:unnamed protein product [Linum trigynum]|uniref:Uncharacterized protein n=1 Tax=Linum trigynum TaxID=586398 RepID=A0AAV2FXU6_9ROSI